MYAENDKIFVGEKKKKKKKKEKKKHCQAHNRQTNRTKRLPDTFNIIIEV